MSDLYAVGVQRRSRTDIVTRNRLEYSKRTWGVHAGSGPESVVTASVPKLETCFRRPSVNLGLVETATQEMSTNVNC